MQYINGVEKQTDFTYIDASETSQLFFPLWCTRQYQLVGFFCTNVHTQRNIKL